MKIQFRDLLAIPFMFLGLLFDSIAISIGGAWTANTMLDWKPDKYNLTKN